jgi:hypothetical protein
MNPYPGGQIRIYGPGRIRIFLAILVAIEKYVVKQLNK